MRIDPRIAARRDKVTADRRRPYTWLGVALVVSIGLAGLAVWMLRSPLLDVDHIDVDGLERLNDDDILAALGIDLGDSMFDIDLDAADDRVTEMPWIQQVSVQRSWPGTVHVTVREREPAAVVKSADGGWFLVDREGLAVESVPEQPGYFLEIIGAGEVHQVGDELPDAGPLIDVIAALEGPVRTRIRAVALVDGEIELQLHTGGRIRLGDTSDLEAKVVAMDTVLVRVDDRCLDTIDVRVPDLPTVTRDRACAGDNPETAVQAAGTATTPVQG